jgi:hypothetical protein
MDLIISYGDIHYDPLEVHFAADDDGMVLVGQAIHRLETDGVDFVVDVW